MKKNEKIAALEALLQQENAIDMSNGICREDKEKLHLIKAAEWSIVFEMLPEEVKDFADEDGYIAIPVEVDNIAGLSRDDQQYLEVSAAMDLQNELFGFVWSELGYTHEDDTIPGTSTFVDALQVVADAVDGHVYAYCVPAC